MKFHLFIFCFTLTLLNCKDPEDEMCPTPILGALHLDTNYPYWKRNSCLYGLGSDSKIVLGIKSIDEVCNVTEIFIYSLEYKIGLTKISQPSNNVYFNELSGDDFLIAGYSLVNVNSNDVFIESIDSIKNEIKGLFNLTFTPIENSTTKFKDTIYFKNSNFTAKLLK